MKFLNLIFISLTLLTSLVLVQSCNRIDLPQISVHELGEENSKSVKRGDELHVDAEIMAEGKIQTVFVSIYPESTPETGQWYFEKTYTKFEGLRNTTFHEDIDIDAEAELGSYEFLMEVTDLEGNVNKYESAIEIIE